jgi:hypothetical protein
MRLFLLALLAEQTPGHAAPSLWIGSTNALAGSIVAVTLNLLVDTNVPNLQFDLLYETNFLASGTPLAGPALADQIILSSEPSRGMRRVELFSFSNSPVTNGVLVFVPFMVSTNAPGSYTAMTLTNVALTNAQHQLVPATWTNGTLEIMNPPRFIGMGRIAGGGVRVQTVSPPGHILIIQASAGPSQNLWTPFLTNRPPLGITTFADPLATKLPSRFYRAVLVP